MFLSALILSIAAEGRLALAHKAAPNKFHPCRRVMESIVFALKQKLLPWVPKMSLKQKAHLI